MYEIMKILEIDDKFLTETFNETNVSFNETNKQYIDALKYAFRGISFKPFILITDDLAIMDMTSPEFSYKNALCFTKKKTEENFKLCALWGLLMFKKIEDTLLINPIWSSKISKAVFRGSTTGSDKLMSNKKLRKYTRLQLVRLSKRKPELLDAGFTNTVQYVSNNPKEFSDGRKYPVFIVKPMSSVIQQNYKYIVVPDGNSGTYGYYWVLASGSVPLKQESDYIQYFEKDLVEFVHYVPIKRDFSDLYEKIQWLKDNDDKAYIIAQNARNYAKKHFTLTKFKEHLIDTLVS